MYLNKYLLYPTYIYSDFHWLIDLFNSYLCFC